MLHELSTGKGTKAGAGRTGLGHHMHKAATRFTMIRKEVGPFFVSFRTARIQEAAPGYKAHTPGTIIINLLKFFAFLF